MATQTLSAPLSAPNVCPSMEDLHALQRLASEDEGFADALRRSGSTQEAARLAEHWGIHLDAGTLWRNRGRRGLPSWRG